MPPSVNQLYIKRAGGGLALSATANKYREHVKKSLRQKQVALATFPSSDESVVFGVDLTLYMNKLENPDWFARYTKTTYYAKDSKAKKNGQPVNKAGDVKNRKGERKAKRRYRQVDTDNRVKFIQDCVVRGLGIPDDSQVFEGCQRKIQTEKEEHVVIRVYVADRSKYLPPPPEEDDG